MMWQVVVIKVLCVIILLVSGGTTLRLSKLCSKEGEKPKKEAMALGMLMSLILFGLMLYKVVII